ncbi:MAG: acetylxylan esterase [Lentisphaeria bacterium]|nr:acetylxylan esterase [Lentisphaeria bacterium]
MKRFLIAALAAIVASGCSCPDGECKQEQQPAPAPQTAKAPKKADAAQAPKKTDAVKAPKKKAPAKKSQDAKPKKSLDTKYAGVQILGETDKSALSYKPGEEMVFTFKVDFGKVEPGKLFLQYTRRGDDNKTFSGKAPADKPLVVKTSLDRPGFVSVNVYLIDEKGKRVTYEYMRWNNRKARQSIAFFAGAGVQAEKLKDCGEPADFDAFWAKQKQRLAALPFAGKVEKTLVKEYPNGYVYAVSIPAPGPRPATGYMTVPKNAKAKSLPILLTFYGYGTHIQKPPTNVAKNKIFFSLNAHGQKLGQKAAYYREFFKSIRTPKYSYAFDPEQNKDPENCFFNGMVMRILRTLEYLKSLPEWDGKNLTVAGGSQGGLQTMWAAALDQDVTVAMPSITWCCDMAGTEKAKRIHGPWRIKYVPALDYFDPVFMAKRIKKAEVTITRAGLGDYTCPPSGLAVSYNNLATPRKTIRWVQGSDHGFVPKKSEVIVWSTVKK